SMLFRNLLAMETEEQIRSQPMDAAVLVGGCDKTVPAQLMAAVSADVPAVELVVGPMVTGSWRGERLGACTDCRRMWASHRAGELDDAEIAEVQANLCPTAGTCMVMGTASTMACLTEALGMMVPGGATPPSATGRRLQIGVQTGRLAVQLARTGRRPSTFLDRRSFHNAATALVALGGSTNAVIHLIAIARRAGVALTLDDVDRIARATPLLVDCKPTGAGYLEDLDRAGGMPTLLRELLDAGLLEPDAGTVSGVSLGEVVRSSVGPRDAPPATGTVRTASAPLGPPGSIRVVRGSLAPDGAVIKAAAASPSLLRHTGPALVFDSVEEATVRLDDPDLEVTAEHVLVLRNAGPRGAGMPEAGSLPIPRPLAARGVRDMVRVSDARMSGTAYGTVVLHVSPEAAVGGPLALVRDGDLIALDVEAGTLDLLVEPEVLERRRGDWQPPPLPARGWQRLHGEQVLPAHLGADLAVLAPSTQDHGAPTTEASERDGHG
ncbi:MAG: dihydroxy-acid dehydratase, partial [Acidimicrobiales bacterium]|nr:dihydroxy-acid dehydratase [Acidimicrobiales bacterium]